MRGDGVPPWGLLGTLLRMVCPLGGMYRGEGELWELPAACFGAGFPSKSWLNTARLRSLLWGQSCKPGEQHMELPGLPRGV